MGIERRRVCHSLQARRLGGLGADALGGNRPQGRRQQLRHRLGHDAATGHRQVPLHRLRVHLQPLQQHRGLLQGPLQQQEAVDQRRPLGVPLPQAPLQWLGEWHAEWAPLIDSLLLLEGALEQAAVLLEGLKVNPEAMKRNLAVTGGGIMAEPVAKLLAPTLGPDAAKRISADAAETARLQGVAYAVALNAHPEVQGRVTEDALARVTDPSLYIGSGRAQVARAAEWLMAI